jgi:hypothetical protein
MAFKGSEHLVYQEFQDQSYSFWTFAIFKYVIIHITEIFLSSCQILIKLEFPQMKFEISTNKQSH